MGQRVAVFYDWQNVYMSAREAFGWTRAPSEQGNFSPYALARILAAGNDRGAAAELVLVDIHRGIPSQKRDPTGYAANRRQAAAWRREAPSVVQVHARPLRYPRGYPSAPAVEKGVDVTLALRALETALTKACDVAVVFSHDTDLVPVLESISRLVGPSHVETASWRSARFNRRLRTAAAIHHHEIGEAVFQRVATPVNYAHVQS